MMNSTGGVSKKATLLRACGTLVALALLVYLFSQQGWEEIWAGVRRISLWRFALAAALMLISRFAVTTRWHVLLRSSGMPVTFSQSARITFAGFFATNFLPTTIGGDVVRLAGAIQLRFDAVLSTASLIVDRLVGMAGMAMALPLCIPAFFQIGSSPSQVYLPPAALSIIPLGRWLNTFWDKLLKFGRRILKALALWFRQPRALATSLMYSWIHMLCVFIILYLLFAGMGEEVPLWLIGGLYSLVYFITLIPISINGYGLQEVAMTLVFSNLAGVSVSSSLTAALLFRTLMMLASLPGALFLPGLLSAKERAAQEASRAEL